MIRRFVARTALVLGVLLAVTVPAAAGGDPGTTPTTGGGRNLPGTTLEAQERDDGNTSPAPWLIGSGLAAAALIGVGGTILKRRSS